MDNLLSSVANLVVSLKIRVPLIFPHMKYAVVEKSLGLCGNAMNSDKNCWKAWILTCREVLGRTWTNIMTVFTGELGPPGRPDL
jgi:hypothetical protein